MKVCRCLDEIVKIEKFFSSDKPINLLQKYQEKYQKIKEE